MALALTGPVALSQKGIPSICRSHWPPRRIPSIIRSVQSGRRRRPLLGLSHSHQRLFTTHAARCSPKVNTGIEMSRVDTQHKDTNSHISYRKGGSFCSARTVEAKDRGQQGLRWMDDYEDYVFFAFEISLELVGGALALRSSYWGRQSVRIHALAVLLLHRPEESHRMSI